MFDEDFANSNETTNISYKIRLSNTKRRFVNPLFGKLPWDTRINFAIQLISGPIDPNDAGGGDPGMLNNLSNFQFEMKEDM